MNENAKLWVETLRKGEFPDGTRFEQARGVLRDTENPNAYCCLGVACELFRQLGGKLTWLNEYETNFRVPELKNSFGGLSYNNPLNNWLGGVETAGSYISSFELSSLAEQNDHGATFSQIADIIESEPEGLFSLKKESV